MIMSHDHAVILVFLFITLAIASNEAIGDKKVQCIDSERQALLAFKHGLTYTNGMLYSWKNQNDSDCCRWRGVECSNLTNHVIKLDLHGTDEERLSGKIGPALQELSYLNYLDLSFNSFYDNGPIPKHIGSLVNLKYLNLSLNGFSGAIPSNLGNLSSLLILDISYNYQQNVSSLDWLSNLYLLSNVDLSFVDLSQVNDWTHIVSNLPHLEVLRLNHCNLPPRILSFSLDFNFSDNLQVLGLSGNCLSSSIFPWLFNFSTTLVQLDLSYSCLQGYISNGLGNMTSLSHVNFEDNSKLEGVSPMFFDNLCNLHSISFVRNNLQGSLLNFLQTLPRCALSSLEFLRLSSNKIFGTLPDLTLLPNLKGLDLSMNKLNGTVPLSIGQLIHLEFLDLAQNSLEGLIFEAHFSKLTKLKDLVLAENYLIFDLQFDWIPPFQLDSILLKSCKLGPQFPNWLRTQNFSYLDISNTSISNIPQWFWNNLPSRLQFLDISQNNIKGQIPTISVHFIGQPTITLRLNEFDGQVPAFISQAQVVDISSNKFSSITFLCALTTISPISFLDISKNEFSGELSNCWENMPNLIFLSLADNNFSGNIPDSLNNLQKLWSLHLRNNCFSGEFPSWMKKVPSLQVLDLAFNNLSGPIPSWIGDSFSGLSVLSLRSNNLYGDLPLSLCNLMFIYFLDLSMNNITGYIPSCLDNLIVLKGDFNFGHATLFVPSIDYSNDMSRLLLGPLRMDGRFGASYRNVDDMVLAWKGRVVKIKDDIFSSLKSIDLSGNRLIGGIPSEVTKLIKLVSLNLSRNNLSGEIPQRIGRLNSLDILDLSRNQLVGHIPDSLSKINRLSVLDLSYNQLSGKIPIGTQLQSFEASVYMANSGLCGSPLPACPWEDTNYFPHPWIIQKQEDNPEEFLTREFYFSLTISYILSFWLICGTLVFHTAWRHTYFRFMSNVTDWFYIKITIYFNKIQRLIRHRWNERD